MANPLGFFQDSFEQTGQQLGQLPKDLLETATQQVSGSQKSASGSNTPASSGQNLATNQWLNKRKLEDQQSSLIKVNKIRQAMAIMNQQLQQFRAKRSQETPVYMAGRPGAPKNKEEELEMWQKQQEEAKKQKKESINLPGQAKTQGSAEFAKSVLG